MGKGSRPRNWRCPSCEEYNWRQNEICRGCGTDRPGSVGNVNMTPLGASAADWQGRGRHRSQEQRASPRRSRSHMYQASPTRSCSGPRQPVGRGEQRVQPAWAKDMELRPAPKRAQHGHRVQESPRATSASSAKDKRQAESQNYETQEYEGTVTDSAAPTRPSTLEEGPRVRPTVSVRSVPSGLRELQALRARKAAALAEAHACTAQVTAARARLAAEAATARAAAKRAEADSKVAVASSETRQGDAEEDDLTAPRANAAKNSRSGGARSRPARQRQKAQRLLRRADKQREDPGERQRLPSPPPAPPAPPPASPPLARKRSRSGRQRAKCRSSAAAMPRAQSRRSRSRSGERLEVLERKVRNWNPQRFTAPHRNRALR